MLFLGKYVMLEGQCSESNNFANFDDESNRPLNLFTFRLLTNIPDESRC